MPDPSSAAADHAHADIGIVCALPIEIAAFLDRCQHVKKYTGGDFQFRGGFYDGIRIAVVESGMGFARARRARLRNPVDSDSAGPRMFIGRRRIGERRRWAASDFAQSAR